MSAQNVNLGILTIFRYIVVENDFVLMAKPNGFYIKYCDNSAYMSKRVQHNNKVFELCSDCFATIF